MREDHPDTSDLHARVDGLLADLAARRSPLPPACERTRLREAAGLSPAQVADTLVCQAQDIEAWEAGNREPIGVRRTAYARLLKGLKHMEKPKRDDKLVPGESTASPARPARPTAPTLPVGPQQPALFPASAEAPPRPPVASEPPVTPTGPLAVIDHDIFLVAHFTNGTRLPLDADDLVGLLEWTLRSGLHQERLSPHGKDSDPLIVLTPAASAALHLPAHLEDRTALCLPAGHPVLTQLGQAGFLLTRRGFGPWAGIYRPVVNNRRASVHVAVMAWGALSQDGWNLPPLPPSDLARLLGTYAARLLTPSGSTAVCGVRLMTALRPPTKATYDPATLKWVSGPNPGALHKPFEPAPPEAPDAHPLAKGRPPEQAMEEEAWDWSRPPDQQETADFPHVVGLDTNMAFIVAASRLSVGRNAPPRHVTTPAFDEKTPGAWYCDLSHAPHDPRLPSPFTATGQPPTKPAWYTTVTLAYAKELNIEVRPIEAYVRDDHGSYLDPWYTRLRDAYLATMADLGVHKDIPQADYLAAMKRLSTADPALLALLAAIKATGKGGLGKLREGPRAPAAPYTRWPALNQPTWRPDIRAAVISRTRVSLHRKMRRMLTETGRSPLAVLSDCVIYPAHQPTALDVVPTGPDQTGIKGLLCLGVNPGFVKEEGVQTMAWYQHQHTQGLNPARYIKAHPDA
ncbi:telomere-associated protein Tap [Streptomyces sp. enrichment culture]|uniref:telomere-associated protein Tap n=1 Tax=Streptomyces sp. enrichment culture TaxID=1795815 RepID=UPI003F561B37